MTRFLLLFFLALIASPIFAASNEFVRSPGNDYDYVFTPENIERDYDMLEKGLPPPPIDRTRNKKHYFNNHMEFEIEEEKRARQMQHQVNDFARQRKHYHHHDGDESDHTKRAIQVIDHDGVLDLEIGESRYDKRDEYVYNDKRDPKAHRTEMFDDLTQIYILGQPRSDTSGRRIVHVDENGDVRNIPQLCTQFYDPGSGSAHEEKFYYSLKDKTCLTFFYGGTKGNLNRFDTFDDCMRTCHVN